MQQIWLSLLFAISTPALAAQPPNTCPTPLSAFQSTFPKGATLKQLTPKQYTFMQGVQVEAPATPIELPPGDRAMLGTIPGNPQAGGMILWMMGKDHVCFMAELPAPIIKVLNQISGVVGDDL